jgi:DNA-binding transcriptional regulator PaaX
MRARSALFDVYGDHLRSRGDQAPVSALIRLLEPVGIAEPAVRTAISRMVVQGWLEPTRVAAAAGYRASPRAIQRLSDAAARIYRGAPEAWDGAGGWSSSRRRVHEESGNASARSSPTSGTPSTPPACGCAPSTVRRWTTS